MSRAVSTLEAPVDFDAIATIYDGVFPPHVQEHYLARRTRYLLRQARGNAALDVGAGTGLLTERLHDLGLAVVALDPFPQMLAQLQRRRAEIPVVVAQGDAIPYPDDTFDLTYSVAVMHHIARPALVQRTLAEMVRVTRPGGRVVVWDHNPLNVYWPLLMRRVPQDNGAERLVPMRELIDDLQAVGATILRAERSGLMPEFVPRRMLGFAAALERAVEMTPGLRRLCAHNVVVATKH
jgi:ubiquinone/menaquinone biosynthesis C-methylase UbiE